MAPSSSSIPAAFTQLDGAEALGDGDVPHPLAYLAAIRDPRAPSGRRHRLIAILAMAAAAVLTGARSFAAIAEWAADAPQPVRAALGAEALPGLETGRASAGSPNWGRAGPRAGRPEHSRPRARQKPDH